MDNTPEYIKKNLDRYNNIIFPFYQTHGVPHTLQAQNANLSCLEFSNENSKKKMIIVTGYNESYLKYAEVIYDLFHKGYSVYVYDHRGQGFSEKFPNQQSRGFMNSFDELVDDLQLFFNFVNTIDDGKRDRQDIIVLGHSMGGCVTMLAVLQNKITPHRIVLSSPMLGIALTPLSFLEYPIYLLTVLMAKLGFGKCYAFGQTDCFPLTPFAENVVTNCLWRYQVWQNHIRETKEVQLGGPTFQWVRESIKAVRKVQKLGKELGKSNKIPILLLQAAEETIVRNDRQKVFAQNCSQCELKIIPKAKHEILMEVDDARNMVFALIDNFLK